MLRTIAQELGDEMAWREVNILEELDYAVFSLPRFFAFLARKSYLNHRGSKKIHHQATLRSAWLD